MSEETDEKIETIYGKMTHAEFKKEYEKRRQRKKWEKKNNEEGFAFLIMFLVD